MLFRSVRGRVELFVAEAVSAWSCESNVVGHCGRAGGSRGGRDRFELAHEVVVVGRLRDAGASARPDVREQRGRTFGCQFPVVRGTRRPGAARGGQAPTALYHHLTVLRTGTLTVMVANVLNATPCQSPLVVPMIAANSRSTSGSPVVLRTKYEVRTTN